MRRNPCLDLVFSQNARAKAMTVSALASSTASTTTTTTSSQGLGLDTSQFLQLMVEQLQNQNPTDPTDTTEFLNQMVQLSTYDQPVENANRLETVVSSLDTMIAANGLGYIGQSVSVLGDTTTLQDGSAQWNYALESDATDVKIEIFDEDGNSVYTADGETEADGSHEFKWDGVTDEGKQLDDGSTYRIEITATDQEGNDIETSTSVTGKVTGVDASSGQTYLTMGDVFFTLDQIISVSSDS